MNAYPPIADHGLIGDLQTAALVSTDGSIDWFCSPRFDSPSVFGSLLDAQLGGHFQVGVHGPGVTSKQLYLPDTAILITRFMTGSGVGELVDFMPVLDGPASDRHRLVRMLRCVRGTMTFDIHIAPRFDYGRRRHQVSLTESGAAFTAGDQALTLHVVRAPGDERIARVDPGDPSDVRATIELSAGQTRGLVLVTGAAENPREIPPEEIWRLHDDTAEYWRAWIDRSTYTGRWRETLLRSAITLKLMTYAPSGGLVAAPTAGLPEQIGGERNWDYRYTWVRDASFSVSALLGLGFVDEAAAFAGWLRDRVVEGGGPSGPLNIMYRIDGSAELSEGILGHWEGYRGSAPVRIGNGAAGQLQLDIYGEALDSIAMGDQIGLTPGHRGWSAICHTLDWLADNWDQPDEGIWETRGGRQDFTYGRLMTWVAFDRGVRLADDHGRPGQTQRWRAERDAVYRQIMASGWNEHRQAFVQHYDSDVLDSALLRMPRVGFITPQDPMWTSTLRAMESELVTDSLLYRYNPAASPDGLRGSEGTFSLCTFAYVEALARSGRLDAARLVFEKMLTYANHVGLYSEEIALTGEQIGNFPQAFTHLALIEAARTLDSLLDRRRVPVARSVGSCPRRARRPVPPRPSSRPRSVSTCRSGTGHCCGDRRRQAVVTHR